MNEFTNAGNHPKHKYMALNYLILSEPSDRDCQQEHLFALLQCPPDQHQAAFPGYIPTKLCIFHLSDTYRAIFSHHQVIPWSEEIKK